MKQLSACLSIVEIKGPRCKSRNRTSRPQLHLQLRPRGARMGLHPSTWRPPKTTKLLLKDFSVKGLAGHRHGRQHKHGREKPKYQLATLVMLKVKNKSVVLLDKSADLMEKT